MSSTLVVVPCYNEAQRLPLDEFRLFARQSHDTRLLLVNDGSRDQTLEILEGLAHEHPRAFLVRDLPRNMGKAEAVRFGMLEAFARRPDYVGFWDADLATPLPAIAQFRAVFERRPDIQVVIGARMPLCGRAIRRKWFRQTLGRSFARVASQLLRTRIYDTQCGAKLFRATAECQALFQETFSARWIFDVELMARLKSLRRRSTQGLRDLVFELPLDSWEDVAGSKVKPWDLVRAIGELWAIFRRYNLGGPYEPTLAAGLSLQVHAESLDERSTHRRAA